MHVHERFNKTPPSWLRRPQNSGAHQSRTTSGDKCYHLGFGALWIEPADLMPPSTKMPALDPDDRVEHAKEKSRRSQASRENISSADKVDPAFREQQRPSLRRASQIPTEQHAWLS